MKESLKIIQLRGTIFIQQNIGYTDDVAAKFKEMLLPEGKILGVPQPGVPFNGMNPNLPQYGMSWRILKRLENGSEYNVIFNPGKVDVVYNTDAKYGDKTEESLCKFCAEKFGVILDELKGTKVQRIAYAPLYGIVEDQQADLTALWNKVLKRSAFDGSPMQDVNLTYIFKKELQVGEKTIQMNLHHNLFDGFYTQQIDGQQKVKKTFMFQLDINSIAGVPVELDKEGVSAFFENITITKDSLVDNVIS